MTRLINGFLIKIVSTGQRRAHTAYIPVRINYMHPEHAIRTTASQTKCYYWLSFMVNDDDDD